MNVFFRTGLIFMSALIIITTQGCFFKKHVNYSRFLGNVQEKGSELVYIKEGVDFKKYDKIMMDHVVFFFNDNAYYKAIQSDELNDLAQAFHKIFVDELLEVFSMVDRGGPNVLRIRTAITGLLPDKPDLNDITAVVPKNNEIALRKITGLSHVDTGTSYIEIEFLDSVTLERVAVAMAPALDINDDEPMTRWETTKKDFELWAQKTHSWTDKLQNKQKPPVKKKRKFFFFF